MEKNLTPLEIRRHSLAHILATAVLEMFPEAKFGVGPAVENGFYYDFELPRTLIPEDLDILEEKMKAIIKANYSFDREEIDVAEAKEKFSELGQIYKVELIEDLMKEGVTKVSVYKTNGFVDLCRGPHIDSTGEIPFGSFKLQRISGAYWKSDEKRNQLQRIYGLAFDEKDDLKKYLENLAEAEKRDHRKLGKELDLFSFHPEAPGMPFFHPKGAIIYNELRNFWIEAQKEFNYDTILCPSMLDVAVWKKSGHWDHYKEDMYFVQADENKTFGLRPMDCPGAILIYNNSLRSYRDLPLRFAEPGLITRKEKSGQLGGLLRVQQFTQDDAHIFVAEEQIKEEIKNIIALVNKIYKPFGLEYKAYLSTRPDDFMGDPLVWEKAEKDLTEVLEEVYGKDYALKEKDGAFYGPKIDFQLKDSIGRTWQCATIQLDFQMPIKFDCQFINKDGQQGVPVLIHRTIMGSFERFMGILIEHYAGAFPVWLSPVQVKVVPVSNGKFGVYAKEVYEALKAQGIRASYDDSDVTLGKAIREAEKQKIPYILVVGEKEMNEKTVTIRKRQLKDQATLAIPDFIAEIKKDIESKK